MRLSLLSFDFTRQFPTPEDAVNSVLSVGGSPLRRRTGDGEQKRKMRSRENQVNSLYVTPYHHQWRKKNQSIPH